MPRKSKGALWATYLSGGKTARTAPAPDGNALLKRPYTGRILGIDPSLRGTGLAVLVFDAPGKGRFVAGQTVTPPTKASFVDCLGQIAASVRDLIETHQPDTVAIEETIYVQNFRTAQKLGAARGAAIGQAVLCGLPVHEYPPLRVKQAVVGYGRASKEQVSRQIMALLGMDAPLPYDEADAAAVAFCHALTGGAA